MPFGNRKKKCFRGFFSVVLSQFKKCRPSGSLKFNNLGIFQRLKLRILMGKIISISPKLNFTPNTLGCYGLILFILTMHKHSMTRATHPVIQYLNILLFNQLFLKSVFFSNISNFFVEKNKTYSF